MLIKCAPHASNERKEKDRENNDSKVKNEQTNIFKAKMQVIFEKRTGYQHMTAGQYALLKHWCDFI